MSNPIYWIVWVNATPHKFTQRRTARLYAAAQKALGHQVTVKPVGFES